MQKLVAEILAVIHAMTLFQTLNNDLDLRILFLVVGIAVFAKIPKIIT